MALPEELLNIKFAEYIADLKALYSYDENFKAVCDDYCRTKKKCEKAAEKVRRHLADQLEYQTLMYEIEEEILIYLIRRI
ncbi:hypothetical protein [Flavobacterium hungaricum]|uniref:Uncharacterized protein n=1 Tax=Flavobacterium hungaricum TaxID=2082725 RepID=A0ABR9TM42_9FLAO|nr:hypothetical protein [Flavobacterium hungaricum]MBE8726321.1 hypothetical protein [Flavobacterium hungaricum]